MFTLLAACAALMWFALLVLPWQPWRVREYLTALETPGACSFNDVTVLIPARDEAECIQHTLLALSAQGPLGGIVLVDDQSTDGTSEAAASLGIPGLEILSGSTPPPGWSGKLWALHQGLSRVTTEHVLLLDADIELAPGTLTALHQKMSQENLTLVSVMATLFMQNCWEKLLLPPFIYFFKLIYPFALANNPRSDVAAAAGGCILLKTRSIRNIGGFAALHDAIIDDCSLAKRIKAAGGRTWLGLSHDVRAVRPYGTLSNIWNMVARTAFTQLRYSKLLLALCTALLLISFAIPAVALFSGEQKTTICGACALLLMFTSYLPTVRFFRLSVLWALSLPFAACLFLAMTWTSALRYWSGERSRWKNRSYERVTTDQGP